MFLKVEGLCTQTMKGRITSQDDYKAASTVKDGFALLNNMNEFPLELEWRDGAIRW